MNSLHKALLALTLVALVCLNAGCKPEAITEGPVHLRVTEILRTQSDVIAKITIETPMPSRFELKTRRDTGGGTWTGRIRRPLDAPENRCREEILLLVSHVSTANAHQDYVKVVLRTTSAGQKTGITTLPHESSPAQSIQLLLKEGLTVWETGKPYTIARLANEDYVLTVAPASAPAQTASAR